MKCFGYVLVCLAWPFLGRTQETLDKYVLDVNQFYGSILLHNPDITHLINAHPGGLILSYNHKRYGAKEWERAFGYPDTGLSFVYQDMNNGTLGQNFGLYAHFNFYLLKRNLMFRIAQGVAYNTNPYDKETNFRNNAYGTALLSSTYALLNYRKENIIAGLGITAGLGVVHYSNANVRAPNTSTNTLAFNLGLTYDLDGGRTIDFIPKGERGPFTEPIRFNLAFRGGVNESDVVGSGQYPFYIVSAYADKRITRKSAFQLGGDVFFSNFLKELIRFRSIAFPEEPVAPDTDYKRVGMFAGYELFINKLSAIAQLGYYVYYPFDFEGRVYNRIGIKRYFGEQVYGVVTLKSHGAKAEAVEFGIGIRL